MIDIDDPLNRIRSNPLASLAEHGHVGRPVFDRRNRRGTVMAKAAKVLNIGHSIRQRTVAVSHWVCRIGTPTSAAATRQIVGAADTSARVVVLNLGVTKQGVADVVRSTQVDRKSFVAQARIYVRPSPGNANRVAGMECWSGRQIHIELLEERCLVEIRQKSQCDNMVFDSLIGRRNRRILCDSRNAIGIDVSGRKHLKSLLIVMNRQPDLFEFAFAIRTTRGFAGLLDSRQQQRDQNRNDRDNDEQLDERESSQTRP